MGSDQSQYLNTNFENLGPGPKKKEDDGWWIGTAMSVALNLCIRVAFCCVGTPAPPIPSTPPEPQSFYARIVQMGAPFFGSLVYHGKEARMGASGLCLTCSGRGFIICPVCHGHPGPRGKWSEELPCPYCMNIGEIGCPSCGGSGRA